jgi:membrane protein YqaA with SNARE-associated domain
MTEAQQSLDRFTKSAVAQILAFVWGFAEATLFFIVPDVLLTAIGCRSLRASMQAAGFAICGALLGGVVMYFSGYGSPESVRSVLIHIPAIHPQLLERVQSQLSEHGLGAVFFGPTVGIPYKIYAAEWGVRDGSLVTFLLVSIPARGVRFLFSALVANSAARLLVPLTKQRANVELAVVGVFWIGFYAFYFGRFGW